MSDYRELLIGCGFSREKRIITPSNVSKQWSSSTSLTALDNNPRCMPDYVSDLSRIRQSFAVFDDDTFDEIHAYEVLEHIGRQGDAATLFQQFAEFWRVLKPNGYFCATVPHWQSIWAWGDPSHTRVINAGTLVFLDKTEYLKQLGNTAMSDYRELLGWTDFERVSQRRTGELFEFVLRARK